RRINCLVRLRLVCRGRRRIHDRCIRFFLFPSRRIHCLGLLFASREQRRGPSESANVFLHKVVDGKPNAGHFIFGANECFGLTAAAMVTRPANRVHRLRTWERRPNRVGQGGGGWWGVGGGGARGGGGPVVDWGGVAGRDRRVVGHSD